MVRWYHSDFTVVEHSKMSDFAEPHTREITSPDYWDRYWSSVDYPRLADDDPQNGARGYFLKAMDRHLGLLSGGTVLELGGCMSQRLVSLARYRNMKATAIDYAPEAVKKSKRYFEVNGCDVELICANFFSPAIDGRRFDLVTHWGVLEHHVDPMPLIKRSTELCSQEGKVIFAMPQMRGPGAWLWRRVSPGTWAKHIYHPDEHIVGCFRQLRWSCKPIFWGPPLIHMTPCDARGIVPWFLQKCENFAAFYLAKAGAPYQYGLPLISENRGFVAWKTPQPARQ